ncbi:hypothetical protein Mterra_02301 [Calidithermus terrae]|uniref:Uncharacterized protein n=1 Tax=Calidithermus terrae TaxID=1408545 RepID=A0A399EJT7_9DEIN|nr:hypothetical protein [Calidithermus terrae]RIH83349.1 hypothetical protein Mterra_02301 [Calidithermus terrae]
MRKLRKFLSVVLAAAALCGLQVGLGQTSVAVYTGFPSLAGVQVQFGQLLVHAGLGWFGGLGAGAGYVLGSYTPSFFTPGSSLSWGVGAQVEAYDLPGGSSGVSVIPQVFVLNQFVFPEAGFGFMGKFSLGYGLTSDAAFGYSGITTLFGLGILVRL